ncbi:hypothetical protein HMPREF1650_09205 [Corynebacterium freneyi DNF00450]|uniref:Penicillin-binding protein n=2 Tax=Corynebacterium freneyi TaxID=134034 RepID=A0A095Y0Y2_9CORY|nr:hypothetical protein HMPREF1650_09205 [Corynebacterium freneyi DNF00450]
MISVATMSQIQVSAKPKPIRRAFAAALPIVIVAPLVSCSIFGDPESETVAAFARAVSDKNADAAAALTSDPVSARRDLEASFLGAGNSSVSADHSEVEDGSFTFSVRWELPSGKIATTVGKIDVVDVGGEARVLWSPRVLDDRLEEGGRLLYSDDLAYDTPVVDRRGTKIFDWRTVTLINIAPDASPDLQLLAATLSESVPGITAESIGDGLSTSRAQSPDSNHTAIVLREEDLAPIAERLGSIDGIELVEQGRLIPSVRGMRSPALTGLPDHWRRTLEEKAGWTFAVSNPSGVSVIEQERPTFSEPIRTTFDTAIQDAAQQSVDAESKPAAIVAMSARTGGVLAVAQNTAADDIGPIALTGMLPPGSTFKTVTTAAALNEGAVSGATPVDCPARIQIESRTIPNDGDFELGTVPMHTAFARSCNTTQAKLASGLDPAALHETAAQFGLGVDYVTEGLTTVTGSVPVTESAAEQIEASIGQGRVVASPFGIALMEATVARGGTVPQPMLIEGSPGTANREIQPLSPEVVSALRGMMRETVTSGTATELADIPELEGKTGTAEVGDGPAHGWFAGIRGDVVFCTLIMGADSSAPAVSATGRFLRDADVALHR